MNPNITVTQKQLSEFLLNVALVRPVFIWGAPGIGKSSLVENFALALDLTCVSLLGSHALERIAVLKERRRTGSSRPRRPYRRASNQRWH